MRRTAKVTAICILAATAFSVDAFARCETAPVSGRSTRPCGGAIDQGSSNNGTDAAIKALQLGVGLLQRSIERQSGDMDEWRQEQTLKQRTYQEQLAKQKANAAAEAALLESQAAGKTNVNPWATKASSKPLTSKRDDRAPIVDGSRCVKLRQRSKGKIDWDYIDIENHCSFPVELIMCSYSASEKSRCENPNAWSGSDRIEPGGRSFSISTSKTFPFKTKFFTCDMSGIENHSKFCLNPLRIKITQR
jgi:hypothetical protein